MGIQLCVGVFCFVGGFVVMEFGLVSLDPRCVLQLSSARMIVVLDPGCCWAYSVFSVHAPCNTYP